MSPIKIDDVLARLATAFRIDAGKLNEVVGRAATQFPDLAERAAYIKEQLAPIVPDLSQIGGAFAGLCADLAAHSAGIDPDAWGGGV